MAGVRDGAWRENSECNIPGAIYRLINRGDPREPIFKDDADRARFLETLGQKNTEGFGGVGVTGRKRFERNCWGRWPAGQGRIITRRNGRREEKARRIVAAELKRLNWTESELRRRHKGDPKKVRIARRLREKTTMTLKWIAGELYMGAWTHVSNLLSQARRGKK